MLNKLPCSHTASHNPNEKEQFPAEQGLIVAVNIIDERTLDVWDTFDTVMTNRVHTPLRFIELPKRPKAILIDAVYVFVRIKYSDILVGRFIDEYLVTQIAEHVKEDRGIELTSLCSPIQSLRDQWNWHPDSDSDSCIHADSL